LNFTAVVVYADGTTGRVHLPHVYTALLNPPAPPVLNLPAIVGAATRLPMNEHFTNPAISAMGMDFSPIAVLASAGSQRPVLSRARTSANHTISASAAVLDFGALDLAPGTYQVSATVTDWVGNVSAPAQAIVTVIGNDLSGVVVYPNPWDKRKDGGKPIKFANLTDPATVRIFTVSGHWVKSVKAENGVASWDLTNDAGQSVASGLYLYLITNHTDEKARGKLVIIR
jgi:hypothetical protein